MLTRKEREGLARNIAECAYYKNGRLAKHAEYHEILLRIASFPGYDKRDAYRQAELLIYGTITDGRAF